MHNVSHLNHLVKRFLDEIIGNVTIWTAILVTILLLGWMLTLSWPAVPGEPRTGPTNNPDIVQPWVLESDA